MSAVGFYTDEEGKVRPITPSKGKKRVRFANPGPPEVREAKVEVNLLPQSPEEMEKLSPEARKKLVRDKVRELVPQALTTSADPKQKVAEVINHWRRISGHASSISEYDLREIQDKAEMWLGGGMNEPGRFELGYACATWIEANETFVRKAREELSGLYPGVSVDVASGPKAITILFTGNTYPVRNELKTMGARYVSRYWEIEVSK